MGFPQLSLEVWKIKTFRRVTTRNATLKVPKKKKKQVFAERKVGNPTSIQIAGIWFQFFLPETNSQPKPLKMDGWKDPILLPFEMCFFSQFPGGKLAVSSRDCISNIKE